jgi:RNA polymerase sigma factor (sigma-70 family)
VIRRTAYLNRIVVNEVRTQQRREAVADRRPLHPVTAAPASEQVERNESVTDLFRALEQLAPRQREAIVLRYWLDLPLAGIATVMRVRVGTREITAQPGDGPARARDPRCQPALFLVRERFGGGAVVAAM